MADLLDTNGYAPLSLLTPHEQRKTKIPGQTSGVNPFRLLQTRQDVFNSR
jgi:hypothetical protein